MSSDWLHGVWPAIPVPWNAADRVDGGLVVELVHRYRAAGLDGVHTTSTDGEMHVPELAHFVVDHQIVPGALFGARGFYSFLANLSPHFTAELWRGCQAGNWEAAAGKRMVAEAFFREWRDLRPGITASPALAKVATRAGILPEMPLGVRSPYRSGDDNDVAALRRLVEERFPELRCQPVASGGDGDA